MSNTEFIWRRIGSNGASRSTVPDVSAMILIPLVRQSLAASIIKALIGQLFGVPARKQSAPQFKIIPHEPGSQLAHCRDHCPGERRCLIGSIGTHLSCVTEDLSEHGGTERFGGLARDEVGFLISLGPLFLYCVFGWVQPPATIVPGGHADAEDWWKGPRERRKDDVR